MPRPIRARSPGARRASAPRPHLLAEMFKLEAGLNIVHVPYREPRRCSPPFWPASPDRRRSEHHQPAARRQAAPAGGAADPARFETAGRADHGGGRLSEIALAVLARRRGAGRHAARHIDKLNTAFRESLKPPETRALLAKLGADIRSARRPSSARCWPGSSSCGPASSRPPTSKWSERRSELWSRRRP